jgi:hypothetical protein
VKKRGIFSIGNKYGAFNRGTLTGTDPEEGALHPARALSKIGKNMIFWLKIVIFHPKYPNNFRASLRSVQFF